MKDVRHIVTLVDGTLLKGLPILAQAALGDSRAAKVKAKWRLHTQFDLERGVPICIDLTEANVGGDCPFCPYWKGRPGKWSRLRMLTFRRFLLSE